MIDWVSILGTITTVLGTGMALSYFAQIAKAIKTKSVNDLSLVMFGVSAIAITFWLLYGIALKNIPLIVVNSVAVVGVYSVVAVILMYRK